MRGHYGSEGGPSRIGNTLRYVPLPFYTLKVKEGWQKMGRTDDDNGDVVVRGQPVVTGILGTPPELTCTGDGALGQFPHAWD